MLEETRNCDEYLEARILENKTSINKNLGRDRSSSEVIGKEVLEPFFFLELKQNSGVISFEMFGRMK